MSTEVVVTQNGPESTTTTTSTATASGERLSVDTSDPGIVQSVVKEEVLYVSLNQDHSCLLLGTTTGFRVFNTESEQTQRLYRRLDGGIGIVETLHRTNFFFLVGGGKHPAWANTMFILWDDSRGAIEVHMEFPRPVLGVKVSRDRILLCLENVTYLYALNNLDMLSSYPALNPRGVCAMSTRVVEPSTIQLFGPTDPIGYAATPGLQPGQVVVQCLKETYEYAVFNAHESNVTSIAMKMDGTAMATASEQVMKKVDAKIMELRRGADHANIYSLNFSPHTPFLLVTSDSGTCHIFSEQMEKNVSSRLTAVAWGLPGYFSSHWSLINFKTTNLKNCACFIGQGAFILIVNMNGELFRYEIVDNTAKQIVEKSLL
ncbi:WD repeat domain phosphoinositide-interacting protein 3 [Pelomyxa schiedti]|nr:WD repeat domain phosphoinositide-interacting protein 3 [Pelomyxa schiedti]